VFAEDAAGLLGLAGAGLGILRHQVTGNAAYDGVGSIVVGPMLGFVAVVLIDQNRRFLTGEKMDARAGDAALARIKGMPEVSRVAYLRLEYIGPRQILLFSAVDLACEEPESQVAYTRRDLEYRLEEDPTVIEAVLTVATPEETSL
jgi:divalent metal cation (Fe/Co/Zn/Cd) transporter